MLVLQKVVKDAAAHRRLAKELRSAVGRGVRKGMRMPGTIHAEFVNATEGEGGRAGDEFFVTVPYKAAGDAVALKWYVAHELVHVWQSQHGEALRHDAEFFAKLKILCAPCALHYELKFRPRLAKAAGIRRLRRKP